MSKIRRSYFIRLVLRILIWITTLLIWIFQPDALDILQGFNFFRRVSVFHLLWGIWVLDMILQLVPVKAYVPLGSQKLFRQRFRPVQDKINYQALRQHVVSTTKAAYKVMLLWLALLTALGVLRYTGVIGDSVLFFISVTFFVCDLICVLIWCPFRLMMGTRCCTTCRIFNWDHMMMFTPMLFVKGFFSISLLLLAFAVWVVWELFVLLFPERFWEHSNEALRCSECTDKLCTQCCRKLR